MCYIGKADCIIITSAMSVLTLHKQLRGQNGSSCWARVKAPRNVIVAGINSTDCILNLMYEAISDDQKKI